jgi:hypothetical protein
MDFGNWRHNAPPLGSKVKMSGGRIFEIRAPEMCAAPFIEEQARRAALQVLLLLQKQNRTRPLHQQTLVERKTNGLPTYLVRVDFTVIDPVIEDDVIVGGTVRPYEVELRPAGNGALNAIDPVFAARFAAATRQPGWMPPVHVVSPDHGGLDANASESTVYELDDYLNLRNRPPAIAWVKMGELAQDPRWLTIEDRLVAPLHEDKSYGCSLGWLHPVRLEDFHSLPWEAGFVLKPIDGTWADDVVFWEPQGLRSHIGSKLRDSQERIWRVLEKHQRLLCQPFFLPMRTNNPRARWRMARLHYALDLSTVRDNSKPLNLIPKGGATLSRDSFLGHGASDTDVGVLRVVP